MDESGGMVTQRYRLYFERKNPGRNMARFYAMSIEETLFGQVCLTRRWGRIGTRGRTVQHSFDDEWQAVGLFLELLRAKRMRGYRARSSSNAHPTPLSCRASICNKLPTSTEQ
jgi:predicted DNA-binding WGR domain protein